MWGCFWHRVHSAFAEHLHLKIPSKKCVDHTFANVFFLILENTLYRGTRSWIIVHEMLQAAYDWCGLLFCIYWASRHHIKASSQACSKREATQVHLAFAEHPLNEMRRSVDHPFANWQCALSRKSFHWKLHCIEARVLELRWVGFYKKHVNVNGKYRIVNKSSPTLVAPCVWYFIRPFLPLVMLQETTEKIPDINLVCPNFE